jgi:hypothetical protein
VAGPQKVAHAVKKFGHGEVVPSKFFVWLREVRLYDTNAATRFTRRRAIIAEGFLKSTRI